MKRMWRKYLTVFALAGLSGALLLQTSQSVQKAEDELRRLEKAVERERETIHVMHAEWAHLNRPDRLESLAGQYLDLEAPQPGQMLVDPAAQLPEVFVPALPRVKPSYVIGAQPVSVGSQYRRPRGAAKQRLDGGGPEKDRGHNPPAYGSPSFKQGGRSPCQGDGGCQSFDRLLDQIQSGGAP